MGRGAEGSDRGRNYFGNLQERFSGPEAGGRAGEPDSKSNSKRGGTAVPPAELAKLGNTSMQVAVSSEHRERSRQEGAAGSPESGGGKLQAERDSSRLFGIIDTREMKELMRRLNFTRCAHYHPCRCHCIDLHVVVTAGLASNCCSL